MASIAIVGFTLQNFSYCSYTDLLPNLVGRNVNKNKTRKYVDAIKIYLHQREENANFI